MSAFSTWMRRDRDPLSVAHLGRGMTVSTSVRFRDAYPAWRAGTCDGKAGMLDAADLTLDLSTYYLQGLRATYEQADRHEYLAMEAALAPVRRSLEALDRERTDLLQELDLHRDDLEKLHGRAKPDLSSIQRGVAEANADDSVVLARRQRTWDAPVSAKKAEIGQLESRLRSIDAQAADHLAIVEVGFDVAVTRTDRTRKYYERAGELYRRAFSRAAANGTVIQAAGIGTITIPAPEWTQKPCPWIPAGLQPTTAQKESAHV